MGSIREQYMRAWEHVLTTTDAVGPAGWDAPSPCAGWTAGHVAGHLVDGARQVTAQLAGGAPVVPTGEAAAVRGLAGDDPAARLREVVAPLDARVRALDLRTAVATPHGDLPADRYLATALVEPVVHGWDLAVATGSPVRLDDDAVASLLGAAEELGGQLAATGLYAPAVPVAGTARPADRLLGLLGRRAAATVTGTAAGVPFTALPPAGVPDGPVPLLVTWHMLDAPRTDAAFAAALPMAGVPAWRVHLGMPLCGARMVDGRVDAILERAREDPLLAYLAAFVHQAAAEFPAALAALREQLPVDGGPVAVLGASLGGSVALQVLAQRRVPVRAAALVNPGVRIRPAVALVERFTGRPYRWTPEAERVADGLDFVARAADLAAGPPLLLVSGENDHPELRADAAALVDVLRAHGDDVELVTVPGLAHALAEEPGLEPAPQLPAARAVDEALTAWFGRQLGTG